MGNEYVDINQFFSDFYQSAFRRFNPYFTKIIDCTLEILNCHNILKDVEYRMAHSWWFSVSIVQKIILYFKTHVDVSFARQIIEQWLLIPKENNYALKLEVIKQLKDDKQWIDKLNKIDSLLIKKTLYSHPELVQNLKKYPQKTCVSCNEGFADTAPLVANICDMCRNWKNKSHITELEGIGKYGSHGVCYVCLKTKFLRSMYNIHQWRELRLFHEDADTQLAYFIGYPPSVQQQIMIQGWYIADRTCCMPIAVAAKLFANYQNYRIQLHNTSKPCNVRYRNIPIPASTANAHAIIQAHFGTKSKFNAGHVNSIAMPFSFQDQHQVWVTDYGTLLFCGFAGFQGPVQRECNAIPLCKEWKDAVDSFFPGMHNGKTPQDWSWFQTNCSGLFAKMITIKNQITDKSETKLGMIGMSEVSAYKTQEKCYCQAFKSDKETATKLWNNIESNQLNLFFNQQLLDKLKSLRKELKNLNKKRILNQKQVDRRLQILKDIKKTKLDIEAGTVKKKLRKTKSNITEEILKKCPEWNRIKTQFNYFTEVKKYALAKACPPIAYLLVTDLLDDVPDGDRLQQQDTMVYFDGYSLNQHVDFVEIANNKVEVVYGVDKKDWFALDCLMCHMCGQGGTGCNCHWKKRMECDGRRGGHHTITSLSSYYMVGRGAWGGFMHAIHGKGKKGNGQFGGVEGTHYGTVARPI